MIKHTSLLLLKVKLFELLKLGTICFIQRTHREMFMANAICNQMGSGGLGCLEALPIYTAFFSSRESYEALKIKSRACKS